MARRGTYLGGSTIIGPGHRWPSASEPDVPAPTKPRSAKKRRAAGGPPPARTSELPARPALSPHSVDGRMLLDVRLRQAILRKEAAQARALAVAKDNEANRLEKQARSLTALALRRRRPV